MERVEKYQTLLDLFQDQVLMDRRTITFIYSPDQEIQLTYRQLYLKAEKLLYHFQLQGLKPGDELVFQLADNLEFLLVYWACLLGGLVAVPIPLVKTEDHMGRLEKIWEILNHPFLVTTADLYFNDQIKERTIRIDQFEKSDQKGQICPAKPDDIALVQFSSGSTGNPKGVILSHKNVIYSSLATMEKLAYTPDDIFLNWASLTFDLGLIGWHLTPMFVPCDQVMMPTELFLNDPFSWFELAIKHQATLLASPNFGYKHLLEAYQEAPERAKDWDLSQIRLMCNGGEPISAELCQEFEATFAPYGLRPQLIDPIYGLAEATLITNTQTPGEGIRTVQIDRHQVNWGDTVKYVDQSGEEGNFVQVGSANKYIQVRVCDRTGNDLGQDTVGEVWIKGPVVSRGYYNNESVTKDTFVQDGWLRTGDLGFFAQDRLVITGRAKEIIFVNGQNYYPHDLEAVACQLDELLLGEFACCGVLDETTGLEKIVGFMLYQGELTSFVPLIRKIKGHLYQKTGLTLAEVIPVTSFPRTVSSKLQRLKLAEFYQQGEYDSPREEISRLLATGVQTEAAVPKTGPTNRIEQLLHDLLRQITGVREIGIYDDFFELGLDSIQITKFIAEVKKKTNIQIPHERVFDSPTLKGAADYITDQVLALSMGRRNE